MSWLAFVTILGASFALGFMTAVQVYGRKLRDERGKTEQAQRILHTWKGPWTL